MSTRTGPGRPVRATWKAFLIACGSSRTSWTSHECLTIGMVMPVASVSWNASVPIRFERTWPVMQTIGVESIHASAIGGDEVRRARAGGRHRDADPAGGARVALGHVPGALLVAGEHVAHGRPARDRVVGGQDRAAGDAEHDVDALRLERAQDRVGAEHSRHLSSLSRCVHGHSLWPFVCSCAVPVNLDRSTHLSRLEVGVCGVCGRVSQILPLAGENREGHHEHPRTAAGTRGHESDCA